MKKFLIFAAAAILTAGCSHTQYIPIETVRTERVVEHDSVFIEIVKNDSIVITERGDTVFVDRWHTQYKDRWRDRWRDSVRVDSIPVPVPVERQLTRWESFCLDYGKLTLGGSVIALLFIVLWIVRWVRLRQR